MQIFVLSQAVLKLLVHHQVGALRYSPWCLLGGSKHARRNGAVSACSKTLGYKASHASVATRWLFHEILGFPELEA